MRWQMIVEPALGEYYPRMYLGCSDTDPGSAAGLSTPLQHIMAFELGLLQ
jgi:hypothetical protein